MNITLLATITLVMGIIFVNDWTDAPNATATTVSTRVLKPNVAIWMVIVVNFLGALAMTFFNAQVAETISNIVSFDTNGNASQVALAASLFSIVVWVVAARYFGTPASESYALIAGLTGSAMALGGLGAVNDSEWIKVLVGPTVSTVMGFGGGYLVVKLVVKAFSAVLRRKANKLSTVRQAFGAGANAFLHDTQDGQKFMGAFILVLFYSNLVEKTGGGFVVPLWVMVLCPITMGIGASVGGMRIIKPVGMDMIKLERYQGFIADLSTAVCLSLASTFGTPVSTTHTKTAVIMGVGASKRILNVDWRITKEMLIAWILTLPGRGLIVYVMSKLFIATF